MPGSIRVLSWNLQNFCVRKFELGKDNPLEIDDSNLLIISRALDRKTTLLDAVTALNPDIIAITEVIADPNDTGNLNLRQLKFPIFDYIGNNPRGYPSESQGVMGLMQICRDLSEAMKVPWRMVPALSTDVSHFATETVGVLYRGDRLAFAGPYVWKIFEDTRLQACPRASEVRDAQIDALKVGSLDIEVYGNRKLGDLVPGSMEWEELRENQLAPRTYFAKFTGGQAEPTHFPMPNSRNPFLVDFLRLEESPPKKLRLIVVHFPAPINKSSRTTLGALSALATILFKTKLLQGLDALVVGDTNSNLIDIGDDQELRELFNSFSDKSFQVGFKWGTKQRGGEPPFTIYTPWNYPIGFGPSGRFQRKCIDNSFFKPVAGNNQARAKSWILDLIDPNQSKGQGFNESQSFKFMSDDFKTLRTANKAADLNKWENAGKIRGMGIGDPLSQVWGVSDHLPLVVDITWK
jgi:hypothetical protein